MKEAYRATLDRGDPGGAPVGASSRAAAAGTRRRWWIATAAPVVAAAAISQTWFQKGSFIASGDIPPFVRTAVEAEYTWAWNHDLTGAGSPSFQIVRVFEVLMIDAVRLLGGGEAVAQRVHYALLFSLVALGAVAFARRFTDNPAAVALAGVFACVNPFMLSQVPNPLVLAAVGLMGLGGALVVGAAQGERLRPVALAVTTVGFSYLLLNVVLTVVAVAWLLVLAALGRALAGRGGSFRAVNLLLRAVPWAILLNLWWLVPAVATFLGDGALDVAVSADVRTWAWSHARGSIANVLSLNAMWSWAFPEYFPYATTLDRATWGWLRFVPPLVCLSAPLWSTGRMRRVSVVLLSLVLGAVLIGKGVHPPLRGLNLWLYDHVPAFWLLREPIGKIGPALVLLYAALIAIAATATARRVASIRSEGVRRLGVAVASAAVVAVVAYPYPLWNGELLPDERPVLPSPNVRLPEEWRAAADHLNYQPERGKALVLPIADYYQVPTTWGYYGIDAVPKLLLHRPTIQPNPENYFGEQAGFMALVRDAQDALVRGQPHEAVTLLRALGVSHVVVRHDIDMSFVGRRFADPSAIAATLSDHPAFGTPRRFGVADVYPVADSSSGLLQARSDLGAAARHGGAGGAVELTWRQRSPVRYMIDVSADDGPFLLVLTETYDPGWKLTGLPKNAVTNHRLVDGYANAWLIEGGGELHLTVEYAPARRSRLALFASMVAAVAAAAVAVRHGWRERGMRRSGSRAGGGQPA